jgi:hypothetical protein
MDDWTKKKRKKSEDGKSGHAAVAGVQHGAKSQQHAESFADRQEDSGP